MIVRIKSIKENEIHVHEFNIGYAYQVKNYLSLIENVLKESIINYTFINTELNKIKNKEIDNEN